MKRLVYEYLGLLCEVCGASSARVRLYSRKVCLLRVQFGEAARRGGCADASGPNLELPFGKPIGGREAGERDGRCGDTSDPFASVRVSAPSGDAEGAVCAAKDFRPCREEPAFERGGFRGWDLQGDWELHYAGGGVKWRFGCKLDGFDLEIDLTFSAERLALLNRRISTAASFVKLFDALVSECVVQADCIRGECSRQDSFDPPLVGVSETIVRLRRRVQRISGSEIPLLITGESGTGKEVVARNVHRLSARGSKPLVIVNSLEIPSQLLQSELFGHMKGSFTGASRDRMGLIECARGGVFFLDEIGEMPIRLQASLLRVLQEKEVRRIGDGDRRKVDVRFVFATNRDLENLVRRGRFRKDLYYRVNVMSIDIPPLRERIEDIMPLAGHFLEGCAEASGVEAPGISVESADLLLAYPWPGNVRELRNEIERVMALYGGNGIIRPRMLSERVRENRSGSATDPEEKEGTIPAAVNRLERRMITNAMKRFGGNRTKTAEALGITRQGLWKKLKRYGLAGSFY